MKREIVYLDNAATSQKPEQVIEAMTRFYEENYANIHRGIHVLSREASEAYEEAHEVVAKFINARSWREVIFVRNTTEAINLVAYSWGLRELRKGDEVVVTVMEHHSNLLPWVMIAKMKGAAVRIIELGDDYRLNYEQLEEAVNERTRVVALTHVSNVLGTINDVRRVVRLAHEVGAICLVDGAQSVPHMPVDVREIECDFLAFSGHKMLGPTGIGVLYGREDLLADMEPFLYGGDMVSEVKYVDGAVRPSWNVLPWKFEAGTPNIVGGIGLAEAVRYLEKIGMSEVRRHEVELTRYALKRLEELDGVEVYGPSRMEDRGGVIAFNVKGLDPHSVAALLDEKNIAVRSGFHCAQPLHEYLGLTGGTVRASFYIYNTKEDVDALVNALEEISALVKSSASEPVGS
ncbi:MAG: cysteine desulfurase [Thermoprotei archaeon]|nr:MAG: cysteine desulfurase [Thermoprotei archaeon]